MSKLEETDSKKIKEGDSMSALAQYLEINRERAYSFASANTKYNTNGRPSVSKEDEWTDESEWDDLFDLLKNTSETEKNDGDV